jgi:hypothetical protein
MHHAIALSAFNFVFIMYFRFWKFVCFLMISFTEILLLFIYMSLDYLS